MEQLRETYYNCAQQIEKSEHCVHFGKTPANIGSKFDESKYMDPPITTIDEYYWLRDDSRTNEKVLNMLNSENELVEKIMGTESSKKFQTKLYEEIKSYIKETYDSLPIPHGYKGWDSDYYYWIRTVEGKSYPIHMRTKQTDEKIDEILLDENELAEGRNTFDLYGYEITDDHKYISYGIDYNGSEYYDLKIIDVSSKEEINHTIPTLSYCDYFWYEENNCYYIYYMLHTETRKPYKLMRYDLQTKIHMEIYTNADPLIEVRASISDDNRYIMINASCYSTNDIYMFENSNPSKMHHITKIRNGHKYLVKIHESTLFILTNSNKATNFKVMRCNIMDTNEDNWQPYIEYDQKINIRSIKVLKNYLLILYKTNGNSKIKVVYTANDYDICNSYDIDVPTVESINLISQNIYETDDILISYQDLKTPSTICKFNLKTKKIDILRVKDVPCYDQQLYYTNRVYAKSHDNKDIPISLIYKKDMFKQNGTNPLYLYGYGAYGITINPSFKSDIFPLLDRGFIYAIAHIRGGSFLGTEWYENGKLLNKMNTFKDFISCAEHLISQSYTSKGNIAIEGSSAGGLLVGATMVMRPELFKTVIAGVPFIDVLNTMCDPTIPLTTPEWKQWGNPNEQIYYDYIKQYSPYDNIKSDTTYPNILALGGFNDPRVQYWEPAKFIAKLRANDFKQTSNLKLLKTEFEQGHFGNTDRYKYMREIAFNYAFVFNTFGITN
jgi:oligopeptidase B